jgi:hypothetical protein
MFVSLNLLTKEPLGFLIKVMLTIQEELIEDTARLAQAKQVKEGIRNDATISDIMQVLEQVLINSLLFSEDAVNDALRVIS